MSDSNEQAVKIIENIKGAYEKIGLYAQDASFHADNIEAIVKEDDPDYSPDIHEIIKNGESNILATVRFDIGDVAWSDRVLDPDKYDTDKQFAAIVPSEEEMALEEMKKLFGDK